MKNQKPGKAVILSVLAVIVLAAAGIGVIARLTRKTDFPNMFYRTGSELLWRGGDYFLVTSVQACESILADGAEIIADDGKQYIIADITVYTDGLDDDENIYKKLDCRLRITQNHEYKYDKKLTNLVNGENVFVSSSPHLGEKFSFKAVFVCDKIGTIEPEGKALGEKYIIFHLYDKWFYVFTDDIHV